MVNIGSGVSMLLMENGEERKKFKFTRIGGTSIGGGFLMGLIKLETGETDYR
jgi:pantothenate kinase